MVWYLKREGEVHVQLLNAYAKLEEGDGLSLV